MVTAPVSIAKQWVYALLSSHAALTGVIGTYEGGPSIFPSLAPVDEVGVHVTYAHSAWQMQPTMSGKPAQWLAHFDVSAWSPGWDDAVLAPVEAGLMTALLGPELAGRTAGFQVGDVQGFLSIRAVAPLPTSAEYEAGGVWQRVSHQFRLTVQ